MRLRRSRHGRNTRLALKLGVIPAAQGTLLSWERKQRLFIRAARTALGGISLLVACAAFWPTDESRRLLDWFAPAC